MDALAIAEHAQGLSDDDLRRMVGPDPHRPGPDRARLIEHGIPVWAIIGHLATLHDGADVTRSRPEVIRQAAEDYHIPVAAVAAALLYYQEHRDAIETRLAINAASA